MNLKTAIDNSVDYLCLEIIMYVFPEQLTENRDNREVRVIVIVAWTVFEVCATGSRFATFQPHLTNGNRLRGVPGEGGGGGHEQKRYDRRLSSSKT